MNDKVIKTKCSGFLDKYFTCISKSEDFLECKLYIDLMDKCNLNQKKVSK